MKIDNPLHLKYRPKTFDEVIGNEKVLALLKSVLGRESGRPHSILFSGPSGCGKTTLARIIKTELGCSDRDFHELNMSNTRGIDTVREMVVNSKYAPVNSPCKIYLLDEFHRVTIDSQNAILKILEDTPSHVYFILCTTEPEKLLKTIKTRCTKYAVTSQTKRGLQKLVERVLAEEGVKDFPEDAIKEIIRVADGSPRNVLVALDSVIDLENDDEIVAAIMDFTVSESGIKDLCQALLQNKTWATVSKILAGMQEEPETIRYAVLGYMNTVLMGAENPRAAQIISNFLESFMYTKRAGLTYACFVSTPASKKKK
jgi:DNA polymerase III gamma/tau subunit